MASRLLVIFNIVNLLFLLVGGLFLGFAIKSSMIIAETPTEYNVAERILLAECNRNAIIANACFIIATFLISIPALSLPLNRGWLRLHGWLVMFCAAFTLIVGLTLWFKTLTTRNMLAGLWESQSQQVQSFLQQRFKCCGYVDNSSDAVPIFIVDDMCTSAVVAAQKGGCIGPFSDFANSYMDHIFTSAFGAVGLDVILLLCTAMMLKRRQEQERYRYIDRKNGL